MALQSLTGSEVLGYPGLCCVAPPDLTGAPGTTSCHPIHPPWLQPSQRCDLGRGIAVLYYLLWTMNGFPKIPENLKSYVTYYHRQGCLVIVFIWLSASVLH